MHACPALETGTNACYVEKVANIKTMPPDYKPNTDLMCINTEWGQFDSDCLPRLDEDWCAYAAVPKTCCLAACFPAAGRASIGKAVPN